MKKKENGEFKSLLRREKSVGKFVMISLIDERVFTSYLYTA